MFNWKDTLSEALRLFFLSIGVSTYGATRFRSDFTRLGEGHGWRLKNCRAEVAESDGRTLLRLIPGGGAGEAMAPAPHFSRGKVDLILAALPQRSGLLLESADGSADRLLVRVSLLAAESGLEAEVAFDLPPDDDRTLSVRLPLPTGPRIDRIPFRVVVSRENIAVYVNRDHLPALKLTRAYVGLPPRVRIGLWCASGSEAVVYELRLMN